MTKKPLSKYPIPTIVSADKPTLLFVCKLYNCLLLTLNGLTVPKPVPQLKEPEPPFGVFIVSENKNEISEPIFAVTVDVSL